MVNFVPRRIYSAGPTLKITIKLSQPQTDIYQYGVGKYDMNCQKLLWSVKSIQLIITVSLLL